MLFQNYGKQHPDHLGKQHHDHQLHAKPSIKEPIINDNLINQAIIRNHNDKF